MDKTQIRVKEREKTRSTGNIKMELEQLAQIQNQKFKNGFITITVGCGAYHTIFCC